ncbi:MAG TPA: hypothetical protein EYG85_02120 [Crocinitomix sp.]|nr:hypothetical protein [Crocinitomix sp.]
MNKFFYLSITIFIFSCEKKISNYQSSESHNEGKDCMQCHKRGEDGEGNFKVAGTVYDTTKTIVYPGATINLYSEPQGGGELIKTIEVDKKGNFYTTERVKFKNDVYPSVVGVAGGEKFMSTPISTGSCNSCHGVSTTRIWVE